MHTYPDLITIAHKAGTRQVTLKELTNLCHYINVIKKRFPVLPAAQLLEELPQLMKFFDPVNFSTHFIVTLLTNPCDHKSDNFMVALEADENGSIQSLSLVGIDNDQALGTSEVSVKTMLLSPNRTHELSI